VDRKIDICTVHSVKSTGYNKFDTEFDRPETSRGIEQDLGVRVPF
jgi:hypothetical protein